MIQDDILASYIYNGLLETGQRCYKGEDESFTTTACTERDEKRRPVK